MIIEHAAARDFAAVLALLRTCRLPQVGVEEILSAAVVAREGEQVVGCAVLEVYGMAALLRSVAVAPTFRGRMLGYQLVQAMLEEACRLGVREVYLLDFDSQRLFHSFWLPSP
jgi:amino-acid N-acetyltransferase